MNRKKILKILVIACVVGFIALLEVPILKPGSMVDEIGYIDDNLYYRDHSTGKNKIYKASSNEIKYILEAQIDSVVLINNNELIKVNFNKDSDNEINELNIMKFNKEGEIKESVTFDIEVEYSTRTNFIGNFRGIYFIKNDKLFIRFYDNINNIKINIINLSSMEIERNIIANDVGYMRFLNPEYIDENNNLELVVHNEFGLFNMIIKEDNTVELEEINSELSNRIQNNEDYHIEYLYDNLYSYNDNIRDYDEGRIIEIDENYNVVNDVREITENDNYHFSNYDVNNNQITFVKTSFIFFTIIRKYNVNMEILEEFRPKQSCTKIVHINENKYLCEKFGVSAWGSSSNSVKIVEI